MNAPNGLWYLDTLSPVAGAVCVGLEGVALVEEVWSFKVTCLFQFTICFVLTGKDVNPLVSAPPVMSDACCHTLPP